mmetsp:Transcript_2899/g.7933  ORF Transcript_2899/g.7933 Transcript_2899/m.7933 type:complete len:101 (+) Transcript_2899:2293-2595(+)
MKSSPGIARNREARFRIIEREGLPSLKYSFGVLLRKEEKGIEELLKTDMAVHAFGVFNHFSKLLLGDFHPEGLNTKFDLFRRNPPIVISIDQIKCFTDLI